MKLNEIKDPAQEFLDNNNIKNYTINPDGTVDVNGNVHIETIQSKFPVKFGRVTGSFNCYEAGLTSLEGSPSYVSSHFSCVNNLLTSLKGAPNYVKGNFLCSINRLTSLHDIHKLIKEIDGTIYCYDNPIAGHVLGVLLIKGVNDIILDNKEVAEILNKYLGQGRSGVIGAQQELLDAGLDEYAKL